MTKIEQNYQLPHLVSPLLPVSWHEQIRQFLDDIASISAIFEVEILVHIAEKNDGYLLASACMPDGVSDEVQAFASLACARVRDVVPFLCVVCGSVDSCAQRFKNGASRWMCREHWNDPLRCVKTEHLPPGSSQWLQATEGAVHHMSVSDPAYEAAMGLARRYRSPAVQQAIGMAETLRARIEIDKITDLKEVK